MYIVNVHISVKPGCVEQFRQATIENALQSIEEPGVARFDVLQQEDQPERFLLVEAYRSVDDAAKHKETAHYLRWRDAVAGMMA
ncbi:MAG TPA: antibiotic biosynthesis monooxygenase, partial [Oligoflexia bacterium]|nr:antibiotic biosynthesis monooxygenase [Oligoflexia bacterium]